MYKECMIIIMVLVLVISLEIVTNRNLYFSVSIMKNKLNDLKQDILDENKKSAQEKMQDLKTVWKEKYNVLAYYIEHDELEKIGTELTRLAANIDVEEYKNSISELDATIYILEHIQEKEKFDWRSIF